MKPSELYAREPEETTFELGSLIGCYYNFIPEALGEEFQHLLYRDEMKKNNKVEVRTYKYFDFDGRRFWKLAGVFFDGFPVMITQNAGREGDDHTARFITNEHAYKKMVAYIKAMLPISDEEEITDIVSADDDFPGLTDFYGNNLDGFFERYRH